MENKKINNVFYTIGLLFVAVVWGLSFVIMKSAIDKAPVLYVLALRFLFAGIPLGIVFFKKFFKATKRDYLRGVILGLVLVVSYLFQSYGCKYTTASKNSMLTAIYAVLVPFFAWLFFKKKPSIFSIIFTVVGFIGVALISFDGFGSINIGDILTIAGGIFFAIQIVLVGEYTKESDPLFLSMIEFLVAGVILICFAPIEGSFPTYLFTNLDLLWRVLFLGLFCTMLCFLLQSILQKRLPVVTCGIVLSLEAPFGVIGGVLIRNEQISTLMIIGIVILLLAVIGVQIYEPILAKIKNKKTAVSLSASDRKGNDIADDKAKFDDETLLKSNDNDAVVDVDNEDPNNDR